MCKNLLNSLTKCIRRLVRRMHDPKEKEENEMNFKDTYRAEVQYFQNLKTIIESLDRWKAGESDEKIAEILESCIQADKSIILLYKNLGQTWNELSTMIEKEIRDLEELKKTAEAYHDELNEKIDDVNNYIMSLVRDLEERVTSLESRMEAVEDDLSKLTRNVVYDLVKNGSDYHLTKDGTTVTFSDVEAEYKKTVDTKNVSACLWVRAQFEPDFDTLLPLDLAVDGSHYVFSVLRVETNNNLDSIYSYAVAVFPYFDTTVSVTVKHFDWTALMTRLQNMEDEDIALETSLYNLTLRVDEIESSTPIMYDLIADDGGGSRVYRLQLNGEPVTYSDVYSALIDQTTGKIRPSVVTYHNADNTFETFRMNFSEYDSAVPGFYWRRDFFTGSIQIKEDFCSIDDTNYVEYQRYTHS